MTWQPGNVFGIISSWCGYRFSAISQYLLTIFSDIMGSTKGFLLRQIGTMPTATTLLTLHTKNVTHRRCHVTVIKQTLEKSRQPISFFVIVGFVLSLWLHIMWNHWFYGCQYNVENKTCQTWLGDDGLSRLNATISATTNYILLYLHKPVANCGSK